MGGSSPLLAKLLLLIATAFGFADRPVPAPPEPSVIAQPDWAQLKRLPLRAVIDDATLDDHVGLILDDCRAQIVAAINARPPELRRLGWLAVLAHDWGRDGLHTFLFLESGDRAPEVEQALRESGLTRQADVLARAMALCGTPYPRDHAVRETSFAWSQPGRQVDAVTTVPNEPNAFDRKLFALSDEFGTLDGYWRAVEGVVEHSPALTAWAEAKRAAMPDQARMD